MTATAKMDSWCVTLEAHSLARRCHRAHEIAVTEDLFGAWLVHRSCGRIGTRGLTKVRSFRTDIEVAVQLRTCLSKRASVARRIGVACRVRCLVHGDAWHQPDHDEELGSGFAPP
jgi:predicted DNA-binding WGR domain protein